MEEPTGKLDPHELEAAFSLFAEASRQLSSSYAELQQQVVSLTEQLQLANGQLKRELDEKAALSRRLTSLLEQLPAGVIELDGRGLVVSMNRAAREFAPALFNGMNWQDWLAANMTATAEFDLWLARKPGAAEHWFSIVCSPVPGEQSSLILMHDMTEYRSMQHALSRHERLVAMGEMAAGLAHQLRTPLAAAMLYLGHLELPDLPLQGRVRVAGKIQNRLQHLEELIQNMLRFVRGQQMAVELLDLREVLEETLQHIQPAVEQAGIRLVIEISPQPSWIRVNRKEMAGVISNLLENALQVAFAGMELRVRLCNDETWVCLAVRDHGPGIAEADLERLFEPFFTTRKDGTGLGLAIVRNLVQAWGGDVQVDTTLGEGAEFTIRLPLQVVHTNLVSGSNLDRRDSLPGETGS
ncbi:sensor histidine kinase [Chitinilyticum litopenaei]|uniref:sensor histidine kinase n=1 Tax=Chitinilyticum litopenaei TaxID=1121276 RepID=UPI00041EF0E2|nr:ATP-binding protein [Chitinilyticum litopenaei]